MAKFVGKPVEIEATQWHQNGDHPADYAGDTEGFEGGELRTFTGADRKAKGWEGSVVRYYRHPKCDGQMRCSHEPCRRLMHEHGWIDTIQGGHIVCPGDWIITEPDGKGFYPCKPDVFAAKYEPAPEAAHAEA